jgi:pseudouridine synthase
VQRLSKLIAAAGLASRRKCEDLIRAGRVRLDGEVVTNLGTKADPKRARIEVDGKPIALEPLVYVLLNKPRGPLSAVSDHRGRQTVVGLVKGVSARLYPAGRLDADTEGLLLLTNDGELTYRLTHPRYGVEKVYEAEVEGRPTAETLRRLARGVMLEDGWSGPARVRLLGRSSSPAPRDRKPTTWLELTIHSGRKRQVRRMLKAVGHPVVSLRRTRMGTLRLGDLPAGGWRKLSRKEIADLWDYIEKASSAAGQTESSSAPKA